MELNFHILRVKKNVPMFITSIETEKAGNFHGKLVVTQRWIRRQKVVKAIQATSRFPNQHGTPIQVGNSEEIGISDPYNPDFGDPWIPENEKRFYTSILGVWCNSTTCFGICKNRYFNYTFPG